ncbi:hypothetical protein [Mesorhizobium sp. L-8-3]|uniref:hypothetical protein n=1 Tax=Mesorhizobium sp. L-8-3 TaxID=2744522 RepID=UPI001935DBE2|nr:hypothetical protein [Mesorhizobium sp. L-8-3]BCH26446.1 hypothetical protein MesoLjLb_62310 [Mesorhizobium sp. L-8-3]
MNRAVAKQGLFKPNPSKAETKADITNHAARAITGDEAARREAKTARLRQARLEREAQLASAVSPAEPPRAKTGSKRRAKSSR